MKTPVAFIIFNRPETTQRVFEEIRKVKPEKLFVIADGPRPNKILEKEQCVKTRSIIEKIDWKCELYKDYSDVNLGCARRVISGLDQVFKRVDKAIILEDDCLPHPTFFQFCEEILEKYENNSNILSVTGQNVQFGQKRGPYSYYFSRYFQCWGWATWQRTWEHFDFDMCLWPKVKEDNALNLIFDSFLEAERWSEFFDKTYSNQISSWAFRCTLSSFLENGLHIIPNQNLVSNIGFCKDATNTNDSKNKLSNIPSEAINFPLLYPPYIVRHLEADSHTQKVVYNPSGKKAKMKKILRQFMAWW